MRTVIGSPNRPDIPDRHEDLPTSGPGRFQRFINKVTTSVVNKVRAIPGHATSSPFFPGSIAVLPTRAARTQASADDVDRASRAQLSDRKEKKARKQQKKFAHATARALTKAARDLAKDPSPRKLTKSPPSAARATPQQAPTDAAVQADRRTGDAERRHARNAESSLRAETRVEHPHIPDAPLIALEDLMPVGEYESAEPNPPLPEGITPTDMDDRGLAVLSIVERFSRNAAAERTRATVPVWAPTLDVDIPSGDFNPALPGIEAPAADELAAPPSNRALIERLLDIGKGGTPRFDKSLLVAEALARVTGGAWTRAVRALDVIEHADAHRNDTRAHADAFAAQALLAGYDGGKGLDALIGLSRRQFDNETQHETYRQALRTAFSASGYLFDHLPKVARPPVSLSEAVDIAKAMTSSERQRERVAANGSLQIDDALHAAHALIGASMKILDPAKRLPPEYREPYASWRWRLIETKAGGASDEPRTTLAVPSIHAHAELDQTKRRLFKGLLTHPERNANPTLSMRFAQRYGVQKAPDIRAHGMVGIHLGHIAKEFEKVTVALEAMIEALRASGHAKRGGTHGDAAQPRARPLDNEVRAAALEQLLAFAAKSGWREEIRLDRTLLDAAAESAAQRCGVTLEEIKISSAFQDLRKNRSITTKRLEEWAQSCSPSTGADSVLETKLQALRMLDPRGGIPKAPPLIVRALRNSLEPSATEQIKRETRRNIDYMIEAVDAAPFTFDLELQNGGIRGAAPGFLVGIQTVLPFLGIGPDTGIGHRRVAVTTLGSTATHVRFSTGKEDSYFGHVGISTAIGAEFWNRIKVSVGYSVVPLGYEKRNRQLSQILVRWNTENRGASRRKLADVLRHITTTDQGDIPSSADDMWTRLCQEYGEDPELSITNRRTTETIHYMAQTWGAGPRIVLAGNVSFGLFLEARRTYQRWAINGGDHNPDGTPSGALRNETAGAFQSTTWSGAAALGVSFPMAPIGGPYRPAEGIAPPSVPLVGVNAQASLNSFGTQVQIAKSDRIQPELTFVDVLFSSADEFKKDVEMHEAEILAELGGDDARETLTAYLAEKVFAEGKTRNNRLFVRRNVLSAEAASRIDAFEAMIAAHTPPRNTNDRREIDRWNKLREEALEHPASWKIEAIAVVEFVQGGASPALLPIYARRVHSAAGVRELSALPINRRGRAAAPGGQALASSEDAAIQQAAPSLSAAVGM